MRSYIPALDTATLPWEPGMLAGSFRRRLNFDPDTGALTGMARFDAGAAPPPGKPHFHHVDEEILVTNGSLTFDHRTWLSATGYCYHPVGTVHGFHSGFRGDVAFFSRNNGGADFKLNYIEGEPEKREWYQAFGDAPPRVPAYIAHHGAASEARRRDGAFRTLLSRHPQTGEGSMFLRLPPGWVNSSPPTDFAFYRELFVVEGEVSAADGNVLGAGFYAFIPPTIPHAFRASATGALIFVSFGGGDID